MAFCKHCNKWLTKGTGKREKEFCNNTCRSNYWYAKNKKGKAIEAAAPKKQYDAPKLPDNFTHDEPLSFDRLRQETVMKPQIGMPKTIPQYMAWKRDIQTEEEYQQLCQDAENNPTLNRKQKDFVKTANPSQL